MKTNRTELSRGLKIMGMTLIFMFGGPTLLYVAFSNQEKPLYIPLLVLGLLICAAAIYFGFKGIQTIMNSMFNNPNSNSNSPSS